VRRDFPNPISGVHVSFDEGGQTARDCTKPKVEPASMSGMQCYNCHENGHRVRDCPHSKSEGNRMKNSGKVDQGERGGAGKTSSDKHATKGDGKVS